MEQRCDESSKVRTKYPDRIPIVCERAMSSLPDLNKHKYLVPKDFTLGQFNQVVVKHLKIHMEEAVFLLVCNKMPSSSATMDFLYQRYRDVDGFLYMHYLKENVFG